MNHRLSSVIAIYSLLIVTIMDTGAHAATFSLLRDPVRLSQIRASNILLQAGTERAISLGSTAGTLDVDGDSTGNSTWTVTDISITPPGLIQTNFTRTINNLWRLQFSDDESFTSITLDVKYTVRDNENLSGFLNSTLVPASRIAVTGTLRRLRERCRGDGTLRDVRGGADFAIDIRQAISDGPHSGTLIVEVNFM